MLQADCTETNITSYAGGKNGYGAYQRIISQIPQHKTYVELFAGSAAVYRHKERCSLSVLIDADPCAPCFFLTGDPFLELYCTNGIDWLEQHGPNLDACTFVYLDPPYLLSTRRRKRSLYNVEITSADHRRLLAIINGLSCDVAISGYWSDMYARELADWRMITWQAKTRGQTMATEHLWMNYPEPVSLHDYRYLGNGYRDRERIRKKVARWLGNLDSMSRDDRIAILAAIRGKQ